VEKGKQSTRNQEMMSSSSSKDMLMRNAAPLSETPAGHSQSHQSHGHGHGHSHSNSKEEVGHRHRISIEDPQRNKARRRDLDDDHSMSSSDFRSQSRLSLATVDSDPGPHRSRHRAGANTNSSYSVISRATSVSSLRTSYSAQRGFSPSARSSASLEQGFITDFNENISMGSQNGGAPSPGPGSDLGSPSLQRLSLHTAGHQSPPWVPAQSPPPMQSDNLLARRLAHSAFTSTLPPIAAAVTPPASSAHMQLGLGSPNSPFDTMQRLPTGQSSPGLAPQSVIPMFQVPPLPPEAIPNSQNAPGHDRLPPFSHLASVADGASEGR
jgi:meiosis induction protein kinase IME2/SME1